MFGVQLQKTQSQSDSSSDDEDWNEKAEDLKTKDLTSTGSELKQSDKSQEIT